MHASTYLYFCVHNINNVVNQPAKDPWFPTMVLAFLNAGRSAMSSWLLSCSGAILPHPPQSDRASCGTLGLAVLGVVHRLLPKFSGCDMYSPSFRLCAVVGLQKHEEGKALYIMHWINQQHISTQQIFRRARTFQHPAQHTRKLPRNSRSNAVFSIFDLLANRSRIRFRP